MIEKEELENKEENNEDEDLSLPVADYDGDYDTQLESSIVDGVIYVVCPHCGSIKIVEPDANYAVKCESCSQFYKVKGVC